MEEQPIKPLSEQQHKSRMLIGVMMAKPLTVEDVAGSNPNVTFTSQVGQLGVPEFATHYNRKERRNAVQQGEVILEVHNSFVDQTKVVGGGYISPPDAFALKAVEDLQVEMSQFRSGFKSVLQPLGKSFDKLAPPAGLKVGFAVVMREDDYRRLARQVVGILADGKKGAAFMHMDERDYQREFANKESELSIAAVNMLVQGQLDAADLKGLSIAATRTENYEFAGLLADHQKHMTGRTGVSAGRTVV